MSLQVLMLLVACGPTATQIELTPTEVGLTTKGATATVDAKGMDAYMSEASLDGIVWTSSDPAVATVVSGPPDPTTGHQTATITAVGSGRAIVNGTMSPELAGSVSVTVNLLATALAHAPAFLLPGTTGSLGFTFQNERGETVGAVPTCTSDAPTVASLTEKTITAVGPGVAKISCTADGVAFDTTVVVFGQNVAGLAADARTVDTDYAFIRQSIGLLPEVKAVGVDNIKLTRFDVRSGKPRFAYELCGTPAKLDMKVKNYDGDLLPLTITGPCGASTFAADALPWAGAPWLPMLLEVDKRGLTLAKDESITILAGSADTWTMAGGGKSHLVSKAGVVQ